MISRLLALTITAAVALGVAGSASAGPPPGVTFPNVVGAATSGTWDKTHTYGVNGKKRTCTLTRGAKCVGARLRGRVKHHGDLRKANLRRADLRFADLRGANLTGARLHHPPGRRPSRVKVATASNPFWDPGPNPPCATTPQSCRGAKLAGANLAYSNLNGINLSNADLSGANLEGAMSTEATWSDANVTGANATGLDLFDTDLTRANLAGADLSRGVFNSNNFTAANLANANLAGAAFGGSDFTLANLLGATVTTGPDGGTPWPDVTWSKTVCPDGSVTNSGCPT